MLSIRIEGDLRLLLERKTKDIGTAAALAVTEATEKLKQDLRAQTLLGGLGERFANTWRSRIYPNTGHGTAAVVYTNAPTIINAFASGAVIRSRDGNWLAIPLPAAPKRVLGKSVTPGLLELAWGIRLRFIYMRGKASLLVADVRASTIRSGTYRAPSARAKTTGAGITIVPMFLLVRQVRLKKRIDIEAAKARVPANLVAALARYLS